MNVADDNILFGEYNTYIISEVFDNVNEFDVNNFSISKKFKIKKYKCHRS